MFRFPGQLSGLPKIIYRILFPLVFRILAGILRSFRGLDAAQPCANCNAFRMLLLQIIQSLLEVAKPQFDHIFQSGVLRQDMEAACFIILRHNLGKRVVLMQGKTVVPLVILDALNKLLKALEVNDHAILIQARRIDGDFHFIAMAMRMKTFASICRAQTMANFKFGVSSEFVHCISFVNTLLYRNWKRRAHHFQSC